MSWYTTREIADALGVSRDTVIREIAAGVLEASQRRRPGGRTRIRVHVDALREYARDDDALAMRVDQWIDRFTGNVSTQRAQ